MVITKKTLILHFQDNPGENREFTYEEGDGDIYINSAILVSPNDDHHYADYIQTIYTIDNPEWKYVILDNEERILYGEHSDDGSIYSPDLSGYIISNGDSSIYASVLINDIIKNKKSIKTIKPINGYYVIYFSSKSGSILSTKIEGSEDEPTKYEYSPIDSEDSSLYKKMKYKRLDMMIDDDTSYSILRVNPKLTGNVKVVVDSESNMYLDTFKVSLGLSQNKYRHIPINPSEYYGRTLMSKMRSITTDDFYKIEDSCYDLFATANDFDEQYYDKYNYGVRTNTDKMYSENYSLLAPLCIRKVLPDFFLIFKINDYESLFNNNNIEIADRTEFIDCNKCELIKSFDFRQGTKLGSYIRRILENNKDFVGDVYTGSDYDHFNIFNGISLEHGVVSNIYEETTQERSINNQVSMNDWYTLGFQRNHIVSKDIINFEFMFDDTSERLFSLPTYFGVYVRLNGEDETFTCIDINSDEAAIFDSSIHGLDFDPSYYPTVIYGISTDKEFKRLKENISKSEEAKSHKLETYKSIVTVDTYDISSYNNGLWVYASNKLNDVLDPGEHYRILDLTNNTIYEVIVSNFFDDDELSDISYTQYDINGKEFQIIRISILNTEYRSNIDEKDKPEIIKKQLSLITKAFNKLSNNISAYDDGKSSFSLLYKKNSTGQQTVMFEKISSICGFNKENDDIIKNTNPDNEYIDKSSYIFGCDSIKKMIIDPKSNSFDNTDIKVYYPIGFESLGTRVAYCVNFMDIVYNENGETMVLINDDIQKSISPYKTVLYTTKFNENKLYRKNIEINYISIDGNFIVHKHTDPMYSIVGFGYQESYIIKFEFNPLIKANGKLQFYQNFPMNSGICSIFPLKDYYLDVLDKDSVFFLNNENNQEEGTKVGGNLGEYTQTETNVYNKQIIQNSEEFIADYCDKFKTYNINTSGFGYMDLNNIEDLAVFLENMQINGHNKFDISLISPYCCKWRILGTDETGNRMRVMYNFAENQYKVYTPDDPDCEYGYLTYSGSIINPDNSFKTSPFIDISENKDIIINSNVPVDIIAYYTDINTIPIELRYGKSAIDTDLVKISNYIRITYSVYLPYFKTTVIISKSYSKNPFLVDSSSYWIPSDDNTHIGFVSCNLGEDDNNMKYTKYIYNYYDEDETGGFNSYIYNSEENGSIEDLLYRNENHLNKFSKIYKYGDNSIEFVSCGIKARIKSTDKSKINLSKYVGYSVILLSMSGNNANQPGTYELFIDETKEQAALIIYNGLSSDNNKIQRPETITSGIHRIKHSIKLSDCVYDGGGLKIKDDGYLTKIEGIDKVVDEKSDIFLISKPTTNGEKAESTSPNQIVIYGNVKEIHFDEDINERYIRLDSSNLFLAKDDKIETINSNQIIKTLDIGNNNVDAYINLSEIDSSTCINIATNSLSLSQLKKLKSYYAITIKNENETKKYNNVASIISIDLVDPFKIERENTKYEVITSGYTHPSYSVPVMKDVFKFEYAAPVEISDSFLTWFNGCNIILNDVDYINQTWMKKVIDIDNIMKISDKDASTMIIKKDISYEIRMVPDASVSDASTWFIPPKINGDIYKEKIDNGLYDFGFYIKDVIVNTYDSIIDVCYVDDMVIKPNDLYKKWIADKYHSLEFPNDFIDMKLEKNEGKYSGKIITNNDNVDNDNVIKGIYSFDTKTLSGFVDDSSIIDTLQFDSLLYGKNDSSTIYEFYFDGTEKIEGRTKLHLRTFDVSVGDISVGDLKYLYFVQSREDSSSDAIKFDQNDNPVYEENGLSRLIYFNVSNIETTKKCQDASILLYSEDVDSRLHSTDGILENTTNVDDLVTRIKFENAIDKSSTKEIKSINQSHSVTLLRNHDPLIGYWYTNMCRLFSKYDTYISYYGAFSGFEKNNYIASRGINLKTKDQNGNIIHGIDLTTWVDTVESPSDKKIVLNITSSIINFINSDKSNGYSDSWGKNQKYINSKDISYSSYKSKYIENTILKLIDINNNTKFILYVDKSSDKLEFKYEKPSDTSSYEEMKNLENTIVFSENRYYMNIENLEPHRYYAEMIIMF